MIKTVIFDIDNTLVPHGADSTPEIDELFKKIQKIGFKTFLLSDNGVKRIERFLKNIEKMYQIWYYIKPICWWGLVWNFTAFKI